MTALQHTGLVVDLTDLDASAGGSAGGKAANLGEMISAGAPVPAGFCVLTGAYERACRELPGLTGELDRLAVLSSRLPATDNTAHVAEAAAAIRKRLTTVDLPEGLATAVTTAYRRLGPDTPVAVRSSATAEDLPHASFAGQQDTYLNVIGEDGLLDAVRRCWSSLWTDRAVFYRAANDIDHRDVRIAVIVQRMVDASTSGVLFTANPVTGRRRETVIDANAGLGESVVSGAVDPDHYIVDTPSGHITERHIGGKTVSVHPTAGGGTELVTHTNSDEPVLTDDELRTLAHLGSRVERHYGTPQDIEWAIDADGTVWLTQSRPVTTLFPLPHENETGLRAYFSVNVAQGVYRPLTTMGAATLRTTMRGVMGGIGLPTGPESPGPWRQVDGWVFFDITAALRSGPGRWLLPRLLAMMEARSGAAVEHLMNRPPFSERAGRSPVPSIIRVVARTRMLPGAFRALRDPEQARTRAYSISEEIRGQLAALEADGSREHLAAARAGIVEIVVPRLVRIIPTLWAGLVLSRMLPTVLGKSVDTREIQLALAGLSNNVTTDMDLRLWDLASQAGADGASARLLSEEPALELASRFREGGLPPTLQSGIGSFLDRHGHRTAAEIDVGVPRWSEQPERVIEIVAAYLAAIRTGHSADERFRDTAAEAEAAVTRIVSQVRRRSRLRARVAGFALDRVRQLAGLREMPKYCMIMAFAHARRRILAAGEDVAAAGHLDAADDIVHLDLDEAGNALNGTDYRSLVARRRATHDRELRRRNPPRVLLSDGTEPESEILPEGATDGGLVGTSASAGKVTGRARVILDPAGAELEPGEVLVAPSTDPGWTPLFLNAGGLVMEMGGPNSHGATVAREYGIPAVVGVPGATTRVATGQRVTVRGSAGTVELHLADDTAASEHDSGPRAD